MKDNKCHIYKFINDNEVLYIGKSKNIKSRILSHIREKDWIEAGCEIYIAETCSQTDMDIYELYYINKLHPKHNKANAYDLEFSNELDDLHFTLYKTINESDLIDKNDIKESAVYDPNSYEYLIRNDSGEIGYILNKQIYTKIHKNLNDLDFIEGYEFQYNDCGNESLRFTFQFDNGKIVYIMMDFSYGDLLLLKDYVYNTIIKNTLKNIYENGIKKDYIPCQLYTDGMGNGKIKVYSEDNHW